MISDVGARAPRPENLLLRAAGAAVPPVILLPPGAQLGGSQGMQIGGNVDTSLGPIRTKYQQLGGAAGPLGRAQGAELVMEDARGSRFRVQFYGDGAVNGAIFFGPGTEAFAIWGPIFAKYQDASGIDADFLGLPVMDQRRTPDGIGEFCHFMFGGSIYHSPMFGAREVHGAIRSKWESLSWERGVLGYPKTDERDTKEPPPPLGRLSRTSAFHKGAIYWTPRWGALALRDRFLDPWQTTGGELGNLGFPLQDGLSAAAKTDTKFEGGAVVLRDGSVRFMTPVSRVAVGVGSILCRQQSKKEVGPDEIRYLGVLIGADGKVHKTGKVSLGEFRDGQSNAPHGSFKEVALDVDAVPPLPWPRYYTLVATLSEIDNGDVFNAYVVKLVEAVTNKVETLLQDAAKKAGAAAGAVNPLLGVLTRSVVSALLSAVFKGIVKRIDKVFKDYVFAPVVVRLQLDHVWQYNHGDEDELPLQRNLTITGHGAEYVVQFQWRL